jgi:hypothetical protein
VHLAAKVAAAVSAAKVALVAIAGPVVIAALVVTIATSPKRVMVPP